MADAISVTRNGHRTFFKWHRGRRTATDPVFTGRRIIEGMKLGASVEVDLVIHADDGMAVLHNLSLERETTGSGLVRETSAETLRGLNLRDNDGQPIADKVMLLEDLAALIARDGAHPEGLLQLDYKEDAAALNPAVIANFARALGPVARHFILSSGDAESVRVLTDSAPGLRIGYDPCHKGAMERLMESRNYAAFVADAVAASPKSELDYLEYRLVLEADRDGFDIIGAFHAHGRRIDAYTVRRADEDGMAVIRRLLDLRVDQITTDDPEGVAALLH
ncbi:glycerophosphodiester phosphodiesterase family protein [Devosia sp. ZB163]|uniref:glycerophosphodiester phosphodiesterase n=1 Tax=Devosia sp. ZB163 TaxID=3025938 RepID=UPI00235F7223|nr:glycerophosphodiester phosphodiesterase family protein [Devosia sp. ZB163]MDC9824094.1 glycerophosphodiester phosphodiesterase family protein [Devosia sp. ZB163]